MPQVAAAVEIGGASAVRAQGLEDIRQVRAAVSVPVIGIWKDGAEGVFITPTLDHALQVVDAGADILALDGTTLSGYTGAREKTEGPDLALIQELAGVLPETSLLVAEGRVHTLVHATAARDAGARAVVVGTAITHPTTITTWFREAVTAR